MRNKQKQRIQTYKASFISKPTRLDEKINKQDTLVIVAVLVGVVVGGVVDVVVVVDGDDVLDVLAKTPCLYLVQELRY